MVLAMVNIMILATVKFKMLAMAQNNAVTKINIIVLTVIKILSCLILAMFKV
jgi:hypothetical protein